MDAFNEVTKASFVIQSFIIYMRMNLLKGQPFETLGVRNEFFARPRSCVPPWARSLDFRNGFEKSSANPFNDAYTKALPMKKLDDC